MPPIKKNVSIKSKASYMLSARQQRRIFNKKLAETKSVCQEETDSNIMDDCISDNSNSIPIQENQNNSNNSTIKTVHMESISSDSFAIYNDVNDGESSSSDESESEFDIEYEQFKESENFQTWLADWMVEENIKQCSGDKLLTRLKRHKCFNSFPSTSNTLLKTPRTTDSRKIGGGEYSHVGVSPAILKLIKLNPKLENTTKLSLQINIDGIPIAKSSGSQFWPILGSIDGHNDIPPFIIGVYHGKEKPKSCDEYLSDFVRDMIQISHEGGIMYNENCIEIEISAFICDAPARAFLQQIKGHTGYYGCNKCKQKGTYINSRVVFLDDAELRSDSDFVNKSQPEHHLPNTTSPLLNIPSIKDKIVSIFPYEYMHLLCLGVMRKILLAFLRGNFNVRLRTFDINRISQRLLSIRQYIPLEFQRLPRSLDDLLRFKATEFRQILLYTGPFIFKDILKPAVYKHFLVLNYAVRILASSRIMKSMHNSAEYAGILLRNFVTNFRVLYGDDQVSYNVHGLLHIAEDVKRFGALDTFAGFKFENYLQYIKKLLRKHEKPTQQVMRRLHEKFETEKINNNQNGTNEIKQNVKKKSLHKNLPFSCTNLYKSYKLPFGTLTSKTGNNCVITRDKEIVQILYIAERNGKDIVIGKMFTKLQNFYVHPEPSMDVGIYCASALSNEKIWSIDDIDCKAICIPYSNDCDDDRCYVAAVLHG